MNERSPVDLDLPSLEESIARQFNLLEAPTVRAAIVSQGPAISFSRLTNDRPQPGRSLPPRQEEAFVFQIPLIMCPDSDVRFSGGRFNEATSCIPGHSYLFDLRTGPTRRLDFPFDNIRLYVSQSTLEEFAYQKGRRRIGGLMQPGFGASDPVLFRLSQTLQTVLEQPETAGSLLVDYIALAFCEHIVIRYGNAKTPNRVRRAGLAPWQMRRVNEFFDAHLLSNPSILDLAGQCGLTSSYFSEAFKQTTGLTPHQWLLKQRIERAKTQLRETDASLATIASNCGFFDQSHFSRVFSRLEGCGPRDWRQHNRRHQL